MAQSFRHMAQTGKEALGGVVKASVRTCVLLLAVTLLCGLAEGLQVGGTDRLGAVTLVGALVITTIAVGDVNSLLAQGKQAISNMEALGDVLLPTVSMATAASGAPAMAVVKHSITILFSDLLLHLIQNLLIPLCYAYVAANVAWAALGNDGLKRIGGLLKWLITILLSVVPLAFIAYLNLSRGDLRRGGCGHGEGGQVHHLQPGAGGGGRDLRHGGDPPGRGLGAAQRRRGLWDAGGAGDLRGALPEPGGALFNV